MNFYIGDPHFGHEAIITNWNKRVTNADTVFILGDMMFRMQKHPTEYLSRLKGRKILILGNHDAEWIWREGAAKHLTTQVSMMELIDKNRKVVLCHYPMLIWPHMRGGSYMVFGHLHGNREHDPVIRNGLNLHMLNSCVEVNGYQPVTLDELIENNRIFRQLSIPEDTALGGDIDDLCNV